jgi:hypothetical protein
VKTWTLLFLASAASAQTGAREIVRQAMVNFEKDARTSLRYSYLQTDDDKNKGVTVSLVTAIHGTPYERVVSRNGEPLTGEREMKEQQKYEKTIAEREHETPEQRAKRLRSYTEDNKYLEEALDAFDYRLLPSDGSNYVLECTPRPGYEPRNMKAKIFTKVEAKAWIDKQDLRLVKVDANITAPVTMGLIVARLEKGGHMMLEQTRVAGSTWLPSRVVISGKAKIMLVESKQMDERISYSDYREIKREKGPQVGQAASPDPAAKR